ncbi:MAG: recombinase family protein [Phycisphaerae bacterium]
MRSELLKGKRYINLVRCSTDQQAETSIPAQLELLNNFAAAIGMTRVDDIVLDGVSGSKPGNRDDIQQLIARKQTKNDFDVLLVQTEDRLTRGGAEHGMWIQQEFIRNGIQIVFACSDAPDGPYANIVRVMKHDAAQQMAISTSLRSTQGYQRALENRNVATSTHSPYGTHRLYCAADDKPLFIIRDNKDGTQDQLDPTTRAVLRTYGTVGGKATEHYRKQKSEKVYLVPGELEQIEIVRLIFQHRYIEGVGGLRIAKELNAKSIPAPMGGLWTQRQVDAILENEVYTGMSVGNRTASGRFYQRAKGSPQKVELDPTLIATKRTIPPRLRPPQEWVWQDQPYLKDYLSEPLRGIAAERIDTIWTQRCLKDRKKRSYNTHATSQYLLTDLLRAKQDGRLLKGQTSGPRDKYVRYYAHPISRKYPELAGFPSHIFRADLLEQSLLSVLTETLRAMPDLKDQIKLIVQAELAAQQPDTADTLEQLQQQHIAFSNKITRLLDIDSDGAIPEVKVKILALREEQRTIENRIKETQQAESGVDHLDTDQIVDSIMSRLEHLADELPNLPIYQLRQLLAAMTHTLTADMVTREVEMVLKLPSAAINDAKTAISELCLQQSSGSSAA